MNRTEGSCPLCRSTRLETLHEIQSRELIERYRRELHLEVSRYQLAEVTLTRRCLECKLIHFQGMREADESFYAKISKFGWYYLEEKKEFDFAMRVVEREKPRRLVEIGAGKGGFLQRVLGRGATEIRALELNASARAQLAERGIECIGDDELQGFDMVCCFQTLEHIPDPDKFLRRAFAALNPGGVLIATVPNPDSPYFIECFDILDYPPHHSSRWPKETFDNVCQLFEVTLVDYYRDAISAQNLARVMESVLKKKSGILAHLKPVVEPLIQELAEGLERHVGMSGHTHGAVWRRPG